MLSFCAISDSSYYIKASCINQTEAVLCGSLRFYYLTYFYGRIMSMPL